MDHRTPRAADRPLRLLAVFAPVLAFSLLLPHGVNGNGLFPALGILPMAISACTSMNYLARGSNLLNTNIGLDIFCTLFLISIFVPSCMAVAGTGYATKADQTVLGALGVAPMMLNM